MKKSIFAARLRERGTARFDWLAQCLALHVISARFTTTTMMSIACCCLDEPSRHRTTGSQIAQRDASVEIERTRTKAMLQDSEERFRQMADSIPEMIQLLIDSVPALVHTGLPDGYLDFFNQTWLEYVGLSLEDIQGWNWTVCIHPDDLEGILKKWRASLASGEPFLHEARVRRADGEYRWMLYHKLALRDECGQIVRWFGSSIDIEDRKRAEE